MNHYQEACRLIRDLMEEEEFAEQVWQEVIKKRPYLSEYQWEKVLDYYAELFLEQ